MSTPINDGGPAFPTMPNQALADRICGGMTLRDYFAAAALVTLNDPVMRDVITTEAKKRKTKGSLIAAQHCYEIADAMLARRTEGTP